MQALTQSIRPFIGAANFEVYKQFYSALGFEEVNISPVYPFLK